MICNVKIGIISSITLVTTIRSTGILFGVIFRTYAMWCYTKHVYSVYMYRYIRALDCGFARYTHSVLLVFYSPQV